MKERLALDLLIVAALAVVFSAAAAPVTGATGGATKVTSPITPNAFYPDPCSSGNELNCDPSGSGCAPCADCYAQAVKDKNDGLEACAELGNPPGCAAGVMVAYNQRVEYCDELCAEAC